MMTTLITHRVVLHFLTFHVLLLLAINFTCTMSEKEKQRFHEMAEQDKKRYDLQMQNYVPPKDVKVRGRKRAQLKDPNAPKRSLSAFFWFCNHERSKVKANNPEYTMGDIAKELGKRWAAADPETKSKYEALSEQDKARYDREMTAYKKGPLALVQQQQQQEPEEEVGDFEGDDEYKKKRRREELAHMERLRTWRLAEL